MKSPFDLLPNIAGDNLPFEPYPGATSVIGLVFQDTDTTYKFFWFLSLLDKAKVTDLRTDLKVEIKELAREMIAQAWPCRRLFKLWFGHQDRLQRLVDQLAQNSGLADNARLDEVRAAALELSEVDLSVLQDFVPYRFLTPWLRSALVGVSDHARNQLIQLLAARSAHSPRPTPYSFDSVIGRPKKIVVSSEWLTFLQSNYLPLRAFAQLSVARYFETRNPGIPGIINKLERPGMRNLVRARTFWDTILSQQPQGLAACALLFATVAVTASDQFLSFDYIGPMSGTLGKPSRLAFPALKRRAGKAGRFTYILSSPKLRRPSFRLL
jgi:hypothetical protein